MKTFAFYALLAALLCFAGYSFAATLPPVACSSATNQAACTTPQATITINHLSRVWTVTTDKAYTALNPPVQTTQVPPQSPATYDQYLPSTVFVAADGTSVTVELHLHYYNRAVSSGRVHYTIQETTLVSGTVQ